MPPKNTKTNEGGNKYYAVAVGRTTGIFKTWAACQQQVQGFSCAVFKSFASESDALDFIQKHSSQYKNQLVSRKRPIDTHSDHESPASSPSPSQKKPRRSIQVLSSPPSSTPSPDMTAALVDLPSVGGEQSFGDPNLIRVHLTFDGGSRGNPGVAGAGAAVRVVYRDHGTQQAYIRYYVGKAATNNEAEYQGLIQGLMYVKHKIAECMEIDKNSGKRKKTIVEGVDTKDVDQDAYSVQGSLQVQGDSNLIIKQLKGVFAVKKESLKPLYSKAKSLLQEIQTMMGRDRCHLQLEHVYREHNKIADGLANEAMDARRSWMTVSEDNHQSELTLPS